MIKNAVITKRKRVSKKKKSSWRKNSCVAEVENYLEDKRQKDRVGDITDDNVGSFFEDDNKKTTPRHNKLHSLDSHKKPISTPSPKTKSQTTRKPDPSKVVSLTRRDLKKTITNSKIVDALAEEEEEELKKENRNVFNAWGAKEEIDELELYRRKICCLHPVKTPSHHTKPSSTLLPIPLPHPGQSYNPDYHQHQNLLDEAVKKEMMKEKIEMKIYNATDAMFPSKKDAPTQASWLEEMSGGLGRMVKLIGDNKELKGGDKKMVKKKRMMMKEDDDDDDDGADDEDEEEEEDDGCVDKSKKMTNKSKKAKYVTGGDISNDADDDVDDDDDVEENDDDDEGGDDNMRMQLSNNAAVRREDKKTTRERRKMIERKKDEDRRKRDKKMKGQLSQAFRVKSLRKEIQREELTRAARNQHAILAKEALPPRPKKLGKTRFTEAPIPLKLTDEIKADLRSLKPEGHVMSELVQSLQRRNITPANNRKAPIKGRRYKPKVFEKKSHKEVKKFSK